MQSLNLCFLDIATLAPQCRDYFARVGSRECQIFESLMWEPHLAKITFGSADRVGGDSKERR